MLIKRATARRGGRVGRVAQIDMVIIDMSDGKMRRAESAMIQRDKVNVQPLVCDSSWPKTMPMPCHMPTDIVAPTSCQPEVPAWTANSPTTSGGNAIGAPVT